MGSRNVRLGPEDTNPENQITIIVKDLKGDNTEYQIGKNSQIGHLKIKIEEKTSLKRKMMNLIYDGKNCEETATITACNITDQKTLHLVIKL